MAFVPPKDRVLEHSTSNSQTVFTVTGALDLSYNAFSASMSVGDTTIGAVVEAGVAFASGVLTYSAANQVTVTTVSESKGTFSSSGVKEVFMGLPAADALTAVDRRNILLENIYQSKLFGGYRRLINRFADGYKASDGINSGSSSNFLLSTTSGNVAPAINGNDGFTKALLHFDGTNGSTTITDSNVGGSAHTWTAHTATLETGTVKIGTAALTTASATGWVDTPDSADFTLASGDFTIDFWMNVQGGAATRRFATGQVSSAGTTGAFFIEVNASNVLSGTLYQGGTQHSVTGTTTITAAGWHHVAFVRTGNNLMLFLDGAQEGSTTSFTGAVDDSPDTLAVGRSGALASLPFNGFIDEYRMSVGIARWTANFTPQTTAYDTTGLNMTVITTSQTADATISNGRVLIEFDATASPTLNTDLTVEVTCDGGTHWTAASLSSVTSRSQGGRTVAETVDQATTGGTSFAARVKTLNGKIIPIYGLTMTVH
jgi:hypothetical protein